MERAATAALVVDEACDALDLHGIRVSLEGAVRRIKSPTLPPEIRDQLLDEGYSMVLQLPSNERLVAANRLFISYQIGLAAETSMKTTD